MQTPIKCFILALVLLGANAIAQLNWCNNAGKAQAARIASGLKLGMPGREAERFLAERGLKPGATFSFTDYWTVDYGLTNGLLFLEMRKGAGQTNGFLVGAWVASSTIHSSSGVHPCPGDVQVARTNAP